MRSIYSPAPRVVILPGPADDFTLPALKYIDIALRLARTELGGSRVTVSSGGILREKLDAILNKTRRFPPFNGEGSEKWGPVLKLFERQWFGRVWVLQECAVAEEAVVLIGEHKRAWEDIGSSVVYFSHKSCSAAVQGFSSRLRNVLGSWGSGKEWKGRKSSPRSSSGCWNVHSGLGQQIPRTRFMLYQCARVSDAVSFAAKRLLM